jgi:hypothetical protein
MILVSENEIYILRIEKIILDDNKWKLYKVWFWRHYFKTIWKYLKVFMII